MNNNKLSQLNSTLFKDLTNLNQLNLSYNRFKTIEASNVINLDLRNNLLENIDFNSISVQSLNLNFNSLKITNNDIFIILTDLKVLYLGFNGLIELSNRSFNGLNGLESLFLNDNLIDQIKQINLIWKTIS